jgi:hypothetical protein
LWLKDVQIKRDGRLGLRVAIHHESGRVKLLRVQLSDTTTCARLVCAPSGVTLETVGNGASL